MPTIRQFVIDAFTRKPFGGNAAAICPLDAWLPDGLMQSIAAENNLSETAFFVPKGDGFQLRWFTPRIEVDLCGHATLAAAHVLVHHLGWTREAIVFETQSGPLTVRRADDRLVLDFPSRPPEPCPTPPDLVLGLGVEPREVLRGRDILAVFDSEQTVCALRPNFATLAALDCLGIIVTAPGRDLDFVSRFFAPRAGINEDPVTGSAHCSLTPFWAGRLGKTEFHARQVSGREGFLQCTLAGDRVHIAGHAVTFLVGEIRV